MLLAGSLRAQFSTERSAISNLSKQRWERVYEPLRKVLKKDSINATARYVMARYFFTAGNPAFQVDSAHQYITDALHNYTLSPLKEREKMKRFPLDSIIIIRLSERIDSAAFSRAQKINTEEAYIFFLKSFSTAMQQGQAVALRDEAAFHAARKENTYQAFDFFIGKYPQAQQVTEAKALYEKLLYEDKTHDKRLQSYKTFLQMYPQTPHRAEVERNIFEIATASGTLQSFADYVEQYPQSTYANKARAIVYHLLPEEQQARPLPATLQSDSINHVYQLERLYLVPFLHKNAFGFMDAEGREVIAAESEDLDPIYRCGNIDEDVLVLPGKVVSRDGSLVYKGEVKSVDDLGAGFLLIENERCTKVIHKTGFNPGDPCVDDATVLSGKLLAIKKDNHWSVRTFTGRQLLGFDWDEITVTGDVVILRRDRKYWLVTTDAISATADQVPLKLKDAFEEVKPWPNGRVWARAGKFEGVFDQHLQVYIPFREQNLYSTFFGGVARTTSQWSMFNYNGEVSGIYDTVVVNKPWVAARSVAGWRLAEPLYHPSIASLYDSVIFAGTLAIGMRNDSMLVFRENQTHPLLKVKGPARIEFIPGQDSSSFFLLEQGDKKILFNHKGQKLFLLAFDRIQYAGKNIFIVTKKDKKGLVTTDGKPLLPVEYDAIGSLSEGTVSLLKARKFGLFDVVQKKLVKPEYSKNLSAYTPTVLVAMKGGLFGFIGWDNKPISAFEFSDIKPWSDSLVWGKKGTSWILYNLKTRKVALDNIKSIHLITDKPEEKLAIIQQDDDYGVIHNKRGIVIPLNFTDIVNVGSADRPMYFTEKHVEEASIFVVIYYNSEGKLLRKEVYEHDDYERIYCSEP
ncbi:MAG TPA: WG repeat-containing protein [Ohtaekwangia sp.]